MNKADEVCRNLTDREYLRDFFEGKEDKGMDKNKATQEALDKVAVVIAEVVTDSIFEPEIDLNVFINNLIYSPTFQLIAEAYGKELKYEVKK